MTASPAAESVPDGADWSANPAVAVPSCPKAIAPKTATPTIATGTGRRLTIAAIRP